MIMETWNKTDDEKEENENFLCSYHNFECNGNEAS